MIYYAVYVQNATPALITFENKEQLNNWLIDFLFKNCADADSWVDYVFEGKLLHSSYEIDKEIEELIDDN